MMFTRWFKKQADRWLAEVLKEGPWHIETLRSGGFLERPEPEKALRRFILSVIEEEVEGARADELRRREEAP